MNEAKKIRILHLLTSLAPGGAETNLLALMKHFDHERYEHAVAYGGGGILESEFMKSGVKCIQLHSKSLSILSLLTIFKMLRSINEYAPDVIHSHLDLPNVVGLVAKWYLKCKLILHFHGLGIIPRSNLPGRDYKHLIWNIFSYFYRFCDKSIAICKYQIQYLNKFGITNDKIALIPNGINLLDQNDRLKKNECNYYFVNIARFFPQKNHELLVNAFCKVSNEIHNARLVLVGDGPLRTQIEKLVGSLSLQDKVIFMGVRRDIPTILAQSDCFVLSSRWELHPITILEAMRASLPVIATNVGGVADTVNNKSGILFESGDESGLVQAMLSVARRPSVGIQMGRDGFSTVKMLFSNALVAKKIENEYSLVING